MKRMVGKEMVLMMNRQLVDKKLPFQPGFLSYIV